MIEKNKLHRFYSDLATYKPTSILQDPSCWTPLSPVIPLMLDIKSCNGVPGLSTFTTNTTLLLDTILQ